MTGVGGWYYCIALRAPPQTASRCFRFANLSGDPAQAYFSDGMAEELRSSLARLGGLKVVGRTSSEIVRNDDAEIAAKKLARRKHTGRQCSPLTINNPDCRATDRRRDRHSTLVAGIRWEFR